MEWYDDMILDLGSSLQTPLAVSISFSKLTRNKLKSSRLLDINVYLCEYCCKHHYREDSGILYMYTTVP